MIRHKEIGEWLDCHSLGQEIRPVEIEEIRVEVSTHNELLEEFYQEPGGEG